MVELTKYSHGAGCGCKISPAVLDTILSASRSSMQFDSLLVGNEHSDDAAVVAIDDKTALVSTTDFFMPIVDDPFDFGRIAATNAISDIYAMGAKPVCAIAIFGWPINLLDAEVAAEVIKGGRAQCERAGIPLAGGHSIDCPEPVFGLAVTGTIDIDKVKRNSGANAGDRLFLTKPLGVGVVTTAQKKGIVEEHHLQQAIDSMTTLNTFGVVAGGIDEVSAITDVTGFGLLGHSLEMARESNLQICIDTDQVPFIDGVLAYIEKGAVPGGSGRNYESFKADLGELSAIEIAKFCDPQTSGGLLIAVSEQGVEELRSAATAIGQPLYEIGRVDTHVDGPLVRLI